MCIGHGTLTGLMHGKSDAQFQIIPMSIAAEALQTSKGQAFYLTAAEPCCMAGMMSWRLRLSTQVMLRLAPAMRARTDGVRSSSAAARVRLCSHCPSRLPSAQQATPLGGVLRADAMGESQSFRLQD